MKLTDRKGYTFTGTVNEIIELVNKTNDAIWVDISKIPMCLDRDVSERLNKWLELYKSGIVLLDNTQP